MGKKATQKATLAIIRIDMQNLDQKDCGESEKEITLSFA